MTRAFRRSLLHAVLTIVCLLTLVVVEPALAKKPPEAEQQQREGLTAREAAARAQARHGGKVLKVERKGRGYRVKLLLDSGRVISVMVED